MKRTKQQTHTYLKCIPITNEYYNNIYGVDFKTINGACNTYDPTLLIYYIHYISAHDSNLNCIGTVVEELQESSGLIFTFTVVKYENYL